MANVVRTCLWFGDGRSREAAAFYCGLIPDSRIERISTGDAGEGEFTFIELTIGGTGYQFLDAGPHFTLTGAVSIVVETDGQAETDRLWDALTAGGKEMPCGWLTDRFGVTWQVYPKRLTDLTMDPDPEVARKAMAAMLTMTRIDIAAIEAAAAA